MFGRETVLWTTAIRGVILAVMAFGVKVTAEQLAAVMFAVEAVLALLTRQSVTPNQDVKTRMDGMPTTGLGVPDVKPIVKSLLFLAVAGGLMLHSACGGKLPPNTAPQIAVAHYGTGVLNALTDVETFVLDGYKAGRIPAAVSDPAMDGAQKAVDGAKKLSAALKAYDAATKLGNVQARDLASADVQRFLLEVETAAAQVFGVQFPSGLVNSVVSLARKVSEAIGEVRAFFPKAGGAPVTRFDEQLIDRLIADATIATQ